MHIDSKFQIDQTLNTEALEIYKFYIALLNLKCKYIKINKLKY